MGNTFASLLDQIKLKKKVKSWINKEKYIQ
jgi:hypothetical protein